MTKIDNNKKMKLIKKRSKLFSPSLPLEHIKSVVIELLLLAMRRSTRASAIEGIPQGERRLFEMKNKIESFTSSNFSWKLWIFHEHYTPKWRNRRCWRTLRNTFGGHQQARTSKDQIVFSVEHSTNSLSLTSICLPLFTCAFALSVVIYVLSFATWRAALNKRTREGYVFAQC